MYKEENRRDRELNDFNDSNLIRDLDSSIYILFLEIFEEMNYK